MKEKKTSLKAVIFDLDGTLADTIPLCITCFRQALEPMLHRSLSDEEIVAAFGPDEEGTIKRFIKDDYKKATSDFMRLYVDLHDMCAAPFEGIAELLDMLKERGVKLALATGKGKFACHVSLEKFGLLSYFTIVETGSPEGSRKKQAIHNILQSFAVDKGEVIYVGDSAGDVKESHAAGIRAVAVAWADTAKEKELQKENPDEFFTTVSSFKDWLYVNI